MNELQFELSNAGTGPAIVEYISVGYNGNYTTSWYEVFAVVGLLDSIPSVISNQVINNRVVQARESYVFLALDESPELMNKVFLDNKENEGLEMILCYRSVFDEFWIMEGKINSLWSTSPVQVDSCIVGEKPFWTDILFC